MFRLRDEEEVEDARYEEMVGRAEGSTPVVRAYRYARAKLRDFSVLVSDRLIRPKAGQLRRTGLGAEGDMSLLSSSSSSSSLSSSASDLEESGGGARVRDSSSAAAAMTTTSVASAGVLGEAVLPIRRLIKDFDALLDKSREGKVSLPRRLDPSMETLSWIPLRRRGGAERRRIRMRRRRRRRNWRRRQREKEKERSMSSEGEKEGGGEMPEEETGRDNNDEEGEGEEEGEEEEEEEEEKRNDGGEEDEQCGELLVRCEVLRYDDEAADPEAQETTNIIERFNNVRRIVVKVQNGLGHVCDVFEKVEHVFDWSDPNKTQWVLYAAMAGTMLCYVVPWRFFLLALTLHQFTQVCLSCRAPSVRLFQGRCLGLSLSFPQN